MTDELFPRNIDLVRPTTTGTVLTVRRPPLSLNHDMAPT